jgi:hypothetical protein
MIDYSEYNREVLRQLIVAEVKSGRFSWPKIIAAVGRIIDQRYGLETDANPDADAFLHNCDPRQLDLLHQLATYMEKEMVAWFPGKQHF